MDAASSLISSIREWEVMVGITIIIMSAMILIKASIKGSGSIKGGYRVRIATRIGQC